MKKEISTSIQINATPEKVWQVLTDFESYPLWNPFIQSLKGDVKVGNRIDVNLGGMAFKPLVLEFTSNQKFSWIGHLFIKGIFDGEHQFELIANPDCSTQLIQSEKFKGILVPFVPKVFKDTKVNFERMNLALKQMAEA
tara:strand:+ start:1027 stop:1443 length:417 start_codon:yes stop_codon:yes gene_type:complete